MSSTPTKCRAIVRTKDGKRYLTRWYRWKSPAELAPDEMTAWGKAERAAKTMVEKLGLEVAGIDGMYLHPKERERRPR